MNANWWKAPGFTVSQGDDIQALASGVEAPSTRPAVPGLRIRELRERARTALGPRLEIRRFQEAVLGSGSLPISALARHVDWFIEEEIER